MAATFEISVPDVLLQAMGTRASDLPRRTLEALVAQSYRMTAITHAQVGDMLGLDRWQTDAFLKQNQVNRAEEAEEFADDINQLRALKA